MDLHQVRPDVSHHREILIIDLGHIKLRLPYIFIKIFMVFRMVEEQNIIKQRQIGNATITEKIVDDDDQPITAEITQEDIQEEKPPSLMWRVGSGLWGASSVRSKNHFVCLFICLFSQ